MKRKVLIASVFVCVLLFSLAGDVYAYPPQHIPPEKTPAPPGETFPDEWLVYYAKSEAMHWGPAVYYGVPVVVYYEGTGCDFFIEKKNYYQYKMQGTAKVYNDFIWDVTLGMYVPAPGSAPIDERPFSTVLKFMDPTFCQGFPFYYSPIVWPMWSEVPVEYFYVNWVIAGVYDFTATCKDGDWTVALVAHTSPPTRGSYICPVP